MNSNTFEHRHDYTYTDRILFGKNLLHTQQTVMLIKGPFFIFVVYTQSTEPLNHTSNTHTHVTVNHLIAPTTLVLLLLLCGHVAIGAAARSICTRMRQESGPQPAERLPFSQRLPLLPHLI